MWQKQSFVILHWNIWVKTPQAKTPARKLTSYDHDKSRTNQGISYKELLVFTFMICYLINTCEFNRVSQGSCSPCTRDDDKQSSQAGGQRIDRDWAQTNLRWKEREAEELSFFKLLWVMTIQSQMRRQPVCESLWRFITAEGRVVFEQYQDHISNDKMKDEELHVSDGDVLCTEPWQGLMDFPQPSFQQ